jgi:hypothetical protein
MSTTTVGAAGPFSSYDYDTRSQLEEMGAVITGPVTASAMSLGVESLTGGELCSLGFGRHLAFGSQKPRAHLTML